MSVLAEFLVLQNSFVGAASLKAELEGVGIRVVSKEAVIAFKKSVVKTSRGCAGTFWRTFWLVPRVLLEAQQILWETARIGGAAFFLLIGWMAVPAEGLVPYGAAVQFLLCLSFGVMMVPAAVNTAVDLYAQRSPSFLNAGTAWYRLSEKRIDPERLSTMPRLLRNTVERAKEVPGTKIFYDVLGGDPFVWAVRNGEAECIGYFDTSFSE